MSEPVPDMLEALNMLVARYQALPEATRRQAVVTDSVTRARLSWSRATIATT